MDELLVGEYLLKRVKELGIESIFGVPGVLSGGLKWKGNPNELLASYAADGYARVKGAGALVTTFGPGELSALCGIAGAYTEFVPVVHIVGYPNIKAQRKHAILHHTTGEGRFGVYHEMSKQICCATTVLEDAATAASEIDRVLTTMMYHSRPVYIGIPTDVAYEKISAGGLLVPLTTRLDPNSPALEEQILSEIVSRLRKAQKAAILIDGGSSAPSHCSATRHGVLQEVADLVQNTGLPVFVTPMGKGSVNEKNPQFGGVYCGAGSKSDVKKVVELADCVLRIGNYPADLNTGEFTTHFQNDGIIDFDRFFVKLGFQRYNLKMKPLLNHLNAILKSNPLPNPRAPLQCTPFDTMPSPNKRKITQNWLWPRFSSFLRPNDLIVVETGTSAVGFNAVSLPHPVTIWTQEVFGSIGYATGAMVGGEIANQERGGGRSILVTGEGSLQLTVQGLSDMLRWDTKPLIFVLNNGGYTVERLIHGPEQPYNDVALWNYSKALEFFGPNVKSESHTVTTPEELEMLLDDPGFAEPTRAKMVEIILDRLDGPQALIDSGNAIDKFNAGLQE